MMQTSVLVALSGGMDSAATVLLLQEQARFGRIEGLYLDLTGSAPERERALQTAELLGIRLHIEPAGELFRREVIDYVVAEHKRCATPGPCSRCNPAVKWRLLAHAADRHAIGLLATGHYVRTLPGDGAGRQACFWRGVDPIKDQSYYLWGVPPELVARAVTPLGEYTKAGVRQLLVERGLGELAGRQESMGVCFLQGGEYSDFLRNELEMTPGRVVELESGRVIGRHDGAPLYTVGQKRGFMLDDGLSGLPYAVVRTEAATNRLYVSTDPEQLYTDRIVLNDWYIGDWAELQAHAQEDLYVMIRGLGRNPTAAGGRATRLPGGLLEVELRHDRFWAPCPGQPAALYTHHNQRLAGGGIIV